MKTTAEQSIASTIAECNMLEPGDRVLCALSGGADSVCMTHFLARWGRENDVAVAAAHFSHGLRPEAAEAERQLAEALCRSLDIGFFAEAGDTASFAAHNKLGTEEAARRLRYDFLRRVARSWGGTKIATAHNLGDQAETVLLHLIRGAGSGGLKGIAPVNGELVRPLIKTSRTLIEDYLARHGLAWAEDATNSQSIYTRNRLRLEVLPLLEDINPQAVRHIAQAGFRLGREAEYFDREAGALLRKGGLDAGRLAAAHPAVAARAVLLAWGKSGLKGELGAAHIEAVIGICKGSKPSASVSLPGGAARREYDALFFEPPGEGMTIPEAQLRPGQRIRWGTWTLSMLPGSHAGGWIFPTQAVDFPVYIRQRRPGDVIFVHGHHKTVKKLMIEEKIPEKLRDITPILCDNRGVLGIAGIGSDHRRSCTFPEGSTITILCERNQE